MISLLKTLVFYGVVMLAQALFTSILVGFCYFIDLQVEYFFAGLLMALGTVSILFTLFAAMRREYNDFKDLTHFSLSVISIGTYCSLQMAFILFYCTIPNFTPRHGLPRHYRKPTILVYGLPPDPEEVLYHIYDALPGLEAPAR